MTTYPSRRAQGMSPRALSLAKGNRSVVVGAVLLGVGLLAGCDQVGTTAPAPSPASASSSPAGSPPSGSPIQPVQAGVGGLDVRYLDENGKVKTLRVEDFPR